MGRILTQKFLLPLAHLRRRRSRAMRPVFQAYCEGLQFRRAARDWDAERRRDWILQALRRAARRAEAETGYYRELFRRVGFDARADFGFDDFARLPVLERADIFENKENLISNAVSRASLLKDATGGSTGEPTEIWLGAEERGWKESGIEFSFEKIGVRAGARTAYFWGHHLDPRSSDGWRERLRSVAANERYFDCFRLSPEVLLKYHE